MTDRDLQQNVQNALDWDPSIDTTDVGVTVDHGVVTLLGEVRSFTEKATAERTTLGVYGVKAVANDLTVRLAKSAEHTDTEVATAVVNALKWNTLVPALRLTAAVSQGWVTLKGEVDWNYQKEAAARAVRDLLGVVGVTNNISVKPHVRIADVQSKIEAALKRSAEVDARRINVSAGDGKVTLTGNVRSWVERREAAQAAWSAPGVHDVDNRIVVVP